MATPSWYNPSNPVVIIQDGVDVIVPADEQQLPAGTIQVTPNAEIPAAYLANPPARAYTQIQSKIPNTTPGAQ